MSPLTEYTRSVRPSTHASNCGTPHHDTIFSPSEWTWKTKRRKMKKLRNVKITPKKKWEGLKSFKILFWNFWYFDIWIFEVPKIFSKFLFGDSKISFIKVRNFVLSYLPIIKTVKTNNNMYCHFNQNPLKIFDSNWKYCRYYHIPMPILRRHQIQMNKKKTFNKTTK